MKFSTLALFCDDLREEASGQQSLMGIWPDYIKLETPENTVATSRMAIYVRTMIPVDEKAEDLEVSLYAGDEVVLSIASIPAEFVAKTIDEARRGGVPNAGFINRMVASAFPFASQSTLLKVIARSGEQERIAGAASVKLIYLPNPSPEPSEQSLRADQKRTLPL